MSLLWATVALSSSQHQALAEIAALPGDPDRPNMASGEPVRQFMAKHHITQHAAAPHIDGEIQPTYEGSTHEFGPHEELHTKQTHLWKPALEQYVREGHEHLMDPDYDYDGQESDVPYHPQVYTHGDHDWIDEGHHRIIAKRMLGEGVTAHLGATHEPDDGEWD